MAFNTMIGEGVGGKPLFVKFAKAGLVFEERTICDADTAAEKFLDRTMQPNQDGIILTEQRDILRLRRGASAQGNDAGTAHFHGFPDEPGEAFVLDLAKTGFTDARENGGYAEPGAFDDVFIQIEVLPSDLAGKKSRRCGFAAAHKANETDELRGQCAVRN